MKLIATMMLTLDGVYQGPGGPDEDRRGGFDRGGWTASHADAEMWPYLVSMFERADALLLGRKTWEIWLAYWPNHDDNEIGHAINVLPKYVPSTTLKDPPWPNTHVISGDVDSMMVTLPTSERLKLSSSASSMIHTPRACIAESLEPRSAISSVYQSPASTRSAVDFLIPCAPSRIKQQSAFMPGR